MASKSHSRPTLTCPQDKICNGLYTDKFICHKAVQNSSSNNWNFASCTSHCATHLHHVDRTLDSSAFQVVCYCKHAKKKKKLRLQQKAVSC
jgi:hypothetical protein